MTSFHDQVNNNMTQSYKQMAPINNNSDKNRGRSKVRKNERIEENQNSRIDVNLKNLNLVNFFKI